MIHSEYIIELAYLVATALFILALKWLSSPSTAGAASAPESWGCCWPSLERCSITVLSTTS